MGFAAPAKNLSFAYVMNRCYVDPIASERRKLPIIKAIGAFVNTIAIQTFDSSVFSWQRRTNKSFA